MGNSFYYGYEENRNPMLEALVTNYSVEYEEDEKYKTKQLTLFEKQKLYNVV